MYHIRLASDIDYNHTCKQQKLLSSSASSFLRINLISGVSSSESLSTIFALFLGGFFELFVPFWNPWKLKEAPLFESMHLRGFVLFVLQVYGDFFSSLMTNPV